MEKPLCVGEVTSKESEAVMGRSGLSSRRKHSKKKTHKVSSKAGRKKSRRNKSKKLRHNDDSFSCSDDESTSPSLASSSEGEYRPRRARSRSRSEVKGSRKRTRKRSLSEDSTRDSPPVKKRKVSKKKRDSEKRKKTKKIKKKKKSRKDAYISSDSNDSASYSTCRDEDSSSDEGASHGRPRGRSSEERNDPRGRNEHRKKKSSRNRSSSPSKLSDSYENDGIEKMVVEGNSRRLKSVITVAKQPEDEGNDIQKDELKEEIMYDYDDYPSCKSNDSNDGESKKETVDRSEERKMLTSVLEEVNSASGNTVSEVDNLELILRQKALENLSRFRGGLQTKTVAPVENKQKNDQIGVKQTMSSSSNLVQTQKRQPGLERDGSSTMAAIQRSRFTWRRDPSVSIGKEEKAATFTKNNSGKPQAPAVKVQSANLSSTGSVENRIANETLKSVVKTDNKISGTGTSDGQKSAAAAETPSSVSTTEGSSKEQQTETNDNSQFEKKTMSVMRGGEMVQVSYKVYIPNRAPALARRQLKR